MNSPRQQCACGCGHPTNRDRAGKPRTFRRGHHRRGTGKGWWEGGYYFISINGKKVAYHRWLWEQHHGLIPPGHVIHHVDGDRTNNHIDNLVCVTLAEHVALHRTGRTYRTWMPEQMTLAIAYYRAGMRQEKAAAKAGVPPSTFKRHVQQEGIRRTPQQTRQIGERGLAPA